MSDAVMDKLSAESTQQRPFVPPYGIQSGSSSWKEEHNEHVKPRPTNVWDMQDLTQPFGSDQSFDERMRLINTLGPRGMRQYNAARQQAARASTTPNTDLPSYAPYPTPPSGQPSMTPASEADYGLLPETFDWESLMTPDDLDGGSVSPPDFSVPETAVRGGASSQPSVNTGFAKYTAYEDGSDRPHDDMFVSNNEAGQESLVTRELLCDYEATFGTWVDLGLAGDADESGDAEVGQASGDPSSRVESSTNSGAADTTMNETHNPYIAAEGM